MMGFHAMSKSASLLIAQPANLASVTYGGGGGGGGALFTVYPYVTTETQKVVFVRMKANPNSVMD